MSRNLRCVLMTLLSTMFLLGAGTTYAHGDEVHAPPVASSESVDSALSGVESDSTHEDHHQDVVREKESVGVTASFDDFPSLHPLVVHFPIAFILVALLVQIVSLFTMRQAMGFVVLGALVIGFIGAIAAGWYLHPHVSGLSEQASQVLLEHEWYASATLWTAGIGIVLKSLSLFLLRLNTWVEGLATAVILLSTAAVSMAGHHGAQLVHIEGIGPQGNHLVLEEEHH